MCIRDSSCGYAAFLPGLHRTDKPGVYDAYLLISKKDWTTENEEEHIDIMVEGKKQGDSSIFTVVRPTVEWKDGTNKNKKRILKAGDTVTLRVSYKDNDGYIVDPLPNGYNGNYTDFLKIEFFDTNGTVVPVGDGGPILQVQPGIYEKTFHIKAGHSGLFGAGFKQEEWPFSKKYSNETIIPAFISG